MGTGSFLGVKCGRGVLLTTHSLLALRSWKSRAIPLLPSEPQPGLQRGCFSLRRPKINHKYIRVGFLVVRLEPGQVSFRVLRFSAVISVHQHSTLIHSFVVRQAETWDLRNRSSAETDLPPNSTKHWESASWGDLLSFLYFVPCLHFNETLRS
jgi:hypothetical protein